MNGIVKPTVSTNYYRTKLTKQRWIVNQTETQKSNLRAGANRRLDVDLVKGLY